MILEHAVLNLVPGTAAEFVAAFEQAKSVIMAQPGVLSLRLARCLERADVFVLLVEWETLEDHTVGFRGSADYDRWRTLLHHFYEPFPLVEHFEYVQYAVIEE